MDLISAKRPEKHLTEILPKNSGRDNQGHVAMRHQGGRHKRYYRTIDWRRDKVNMPGHVIALEYDPNRTALIALIHYQDSEKRYVLAPEGLRVGDTIVAGEKVEVKVGNAMPLINIPVGIAIHNIQLFPGRRGQVVRSAGTLATILSKEGTEAQVKLPSGEVRLFDVACIATIGQVGNINWSNEVIGSAGRSRHMGIRPTVRGVAQNPRSHPHGGGEGRSGIGLKAPKTQWGKRTLGVITRKRKKLSNRYIVQRRK